MPTPMSRRLQMDQNSEFPLDALSQLQLRVALRADELARDNNIPTSLNLHCWLMAESELVERPPEKGMGPVSRRMVRWRTDELALLAGRSGSEVRQSDYEQAKRELTGESDTDRQNAILDNPSRSGS